MPTPADDLKPGMYVAIVDSESNHNEPEPTGMFSFPFGFSSATSSLAVSYNGKPLEVLAVSLPFVCVREGSKRFALDLRETRVQRLSTQFVNAMLPERRKKRKKGEQPQPQASTAAQEAMLTYMPLYWPNKP
jgi:hypothetical protein